MNDIRIVDYKKEHAMTLLKEGVMPVNYWCNFEQSAELNEKCGIGYTMYRGEQVVICAGIIILWEGVAEAWAIMSKDIATLKFTALKYSKAYLDEMLLQYDVRYCEARPKANCPEAIRFVQHLGFKKYCNLPGFAPDGEDCCLYVISRKG